MDHHGRRQGVRQLGQHVQVPEDSLFIWERGAVPPLGVFIRIDRWDGQTQQGDGRLLAVPLDHVIHRRHVRHRQVSRRPEIFLFEEKINLPLGRRRLLPKVADNVIPGHHDGLRLDS